MSDNTNCAICGQPFGPDRKRDEHSPAACATCVAKVNRELDEIEEEMEFQALSFDLFNLSPEL